jgi:ketosteroid isomerase-like protein
MSQENMETVKRAIAAVNDRDVDGYLACCTEDVQMRTPLASIGAVYEGADAIRRFFVDIQDTVPDFRVELERLDAIEHGRVLALVRITATGRASGLSAASDMPAANVYELADGKIRRVRIFLDRNEALEFVGLSEHDAHDDA